MNDLKPRLIHLMKSFHRGQERAIKKRDLLKELFGNEAAADESYNNRDDRALRSTIEEINREGGMICSSSFLGYWWAESLSDGLPSANENRRRALTQAINARRLVRNLKQTFGGQLSLFNPPPAPPQPKMDPSLTLRTSLERE